MQELFSVRVRLTRYCSPYHIDLIDASVVDEFGKVHRITKDVSCVPLNTSIFDYIFGLVKLELEKAVFKEEKNGKN